MKELFKNLYLFALVFLSVGSFFVIKALTDSYVWGIAALFVGVLFFGVLFRLIDSVLKKRKSGKGHAELLKSAQRNNNCDTSNQK